MKAWSWRCAAHLLLLSSVAGLAACGGTQPPLAVPAPNTPVGLPAAPAAAAANTYFGVQSPGAWTFTLDHSQNTFSDQSITYPASPNSSTAGSIQQTGGFIKLTAAGAPAGYAVEVQGRFAMLRPGNLNSAPLLGVPQTSCYKVNGRIRLQYIGLPAALVGALTGTPEFANGSIATSTDSTGKTWQFLDLQGNVVSGPASFSGSCGSSSQQDLITFTGQQSVLNSIWAGSAQNIPTSGTQSTLAIGPSGFFAADQSDPTQSEPTGASVAGVVEPSAPLNPLDVTSQQYVGFLYQQATTLGLNGAPATPALTSPVSFGAPNVSGHTLVGGIYPNDDVTQTHQSNILITLGTQDTTYNGLFTAASITLSDPAQNCANYTGPGNNSTVGVDAQGYPTCTFPALALVGNPEGKYALFLNTYNWAARLGGAPMQLYLIQQ